MDPYSTHLEALVDTALSSTGPILELGCGNYSTPILSSIAQHMNRRFLVQAQDAEWAAKFTGDADIELVSWADWKIEGEWGMVFLDSEEAVKDRIKRLPELAKAAKVVVLHDANVALQNPTWKQYASGFGEVKIYHKHVPWTAVLIPK